MLKSRSQPLNVLVLLCLSWGFPVVAAETLPGTQPLVLSPNTADVVQIQLKQVREFYQKQILIAKEGRTQRWQPDFSSRSAYERSLSPQVRRCRALLGLEEIHTAAKSPQLERVAESPGCLLERVSIPLAHGTTARGLLLVPTTGGRHPLTVICPDADTWPERLAGLVDGPPPPWLSNLLARGMMIYLAQSIERLADHPYCTTTGGKNRRMILYRLGYPVGRTMPGLDVQDTLAALDYLSQRPDVDSRRIGVLGIGQGGMTALFTAALDLRVRAAVVADYFDCRDGCWQEPVDRRLPGQLMVCEDAELAALVAPRNLGIVTSRDSGISPEQLAGEIRRARRFFEGLKNPDGLKRLADVAPAERTSSSVALISEMLKLSPAKGEAALPVRSLAAAQAESWRNRHFQERLDYLRRLIAASEGKREGRWGLATQPATEFPKIKQSMLAEYRRLMGEVPPTATPWRARSELVLTTKKYKAYRVLLDVTKGMEVYGNLLVPQGLQGRAAVVVCQHGLSGTPEMITGLGQTQDTPYHEFGRRLAERGYVVFAPLLLHYHPVEWTNDQVRLADAVGMMRVALPVAQTQRVVDFLKSLPFVDAGRIGYFGLSYGGYSALWISPLEERLAAIVVSGHFNDWRSKITADNTPTSYLLHPDEDFYNWDVLHRFTHVELVAMAAPRPVCIEYGTRDGITTPAWTAYAWKQLSLIRDHLGLKDRILLAQFDGVHEVRCEESFIFLDRFLRGAR